MELCLRCAEMEEVIARLHDGDTCARQCECTAYRIEAQWLRAALQRLTAAVGDLDIKLADDEIHRAYAEAKALLTPNAELRGAPPIGEASRSNDVLEA